MALKETWSNWLFWRPEKANFRNRKKIAISWRQNNLEGISSVGALKMRIFRIRKKSLLLRAKTTLTRFRVFLPLKKRIIGIWNKSLFMAPKQTSCNFLRLSSSKSEFSETEWIRYFFAQSNLEVIFCVMTLWKSVFSESEWNLFFMATKQPFAEYKKWIYQPKQPSCNFLRFGALKKRISRMPKKSFFHSTNTTLKQFLAF